MFKQLISILFLTGLLFQFLSRYLILVDYSLNKTYIAQNLCENKNKPSMHCNGKCYLNKKLKEEEKQRVPVSQKATPEIQLFIVNNSVEISTNISILNLSPYEWYNTLGTVSHPHSIFHPPLG